MSEEYNCGDSSNYADTNYSNASETGWNNDSISHSHDSANLPHENHIRTLDDQPGKFGLEEHRKEESLCELPSEMTEVAVSSEGIGNNDDFRGGDGAYPGGSQSGGQSTPLGNNLEAFAEHNNDQNACSQGCMYCAVICYECSIL